MQISQCVQKTTDGSHKMAIIYIIMSKKGAFKVIVTPEGFEPSTQGLKVLCSTTELRGQMILHMCL